MKYLSICQVKTTHKTFEAMLETLRVTCPTMRIFLY